MARTQVNYTQNNPADLQSPERRIIDPGLRPQANVLDTFIHPVNTQNNDAGVKAAQLAQSLSVFAPKLLNFAGNMQQRSNERNLQEGQTTAAEMALQGKSYKEAVESGAIKRSDNPFFVAGVNEQFGRTAADKMASDLARTLAHDLDESTDVSKVDSTVEAAQKAWIAENVGAEPDQHFTTGFALRASQHMEQVRADLKTSVGNNLEKLGLSVAFSEVKESVKHSLSVGIPAETMSADLQQWRSDMVAQGRDSLTLDRAMVAAIGEAALDATDPSDGIKITSLLRTIKGTTGHALADMSPEVSKGTRELLDTVIQKSQKREAAAQTARKVEWSNRLDVAMIALTEEALSNPNADTSGIMKSIADIPGAAKEMAETLTAIRKSTANPKARMLMQEKLWADPKITIQSIFRMGRNNEIGEDDVAFLVNQVQERDNRAIAAMNRANAAVDLQIKRADLAEKAIKAVYNDPAYDSERTMISSRFQKDPLSITPLDRTRIANAHSMFDAYWFDYRTSELGKQDNAIDRRKKAAELAQVIVERMSVGLNDASAKPPAPTFPGKTAVVKELSTTLRAIQANGNMLPADIAKRARAEGVTDAASLQAWLKKQP